MTRDGPKADKMDGTKAALRDDAMAVYWAARKAPSWETNEADMTVAEKVAPLAGLKGALKVFAWAGQKAAWTAG